MRDNASETEDDSGHETDSNDASGSPLFDRRRVLSAIGAGGAAFAGIGAFAGTAAAWERLDVNFRDCSEAWIIVDEEDLNYEKYGREEPLSVTAVVETAEGEVECRSIEVTEESTTTVPGTEEPTGPDTEEPTGPDTEEPTGPDTEESTMPPRQYEDALIIQFRVGEDEDPGTEDDEGPGTEEDEAADTEDDEKILAVISYNHNDIAHCYFENANWCAQTLDVADWRDAECADDLLEYDPDRFNVPCYERWDENF